MKFINAAVLVLLSVTGSITAGQDIKPPTPYLDRGACPFECCTYRRWTVEQDTVVYKQRSEASGVAFRVRKGEHVTGVTGIVVTNRPGKVVVKKAYTLDQDRKVRLKPGDIFYLLHYEGEGYSKIWFRGKIYSDEIPLPGTGQTASAAFQVVSEPATVWWVQVRNSRGQIGWTKQHEHFGNMDACG